MFNSQSTINGIFVPNIVPYNAKGRIDEDELRHIIRWVGDKGDTGFYPNGSMGEFIRLSYEEAASECSLGKSDSSPMNVEAIVQAVLKNTEAAQSR